MQGKAPVELTSKPSAGLIPDCRLLVYPGAPHGLMFTPMDQLNADILPSCVRETAARPPPDLSQTKANKRH